MKNYKIMFYEALERERLLRPKGIREHSKSPAVRNKPRVLLKKDKYLI